MLMEAESDPGIGSGGKIASSELWRHRIGAVRIELGTNEAHFISGRI